MTLLRDRIDSNPKYVNVSHPKKRAITHAVADKLVEKTVAFHDKPLKALIEALIEEEASKQ